MTVNLSQDEVDKLRDLADWLGDFVRRDATNPRQQPVSPASAFNIEATPRPRSEERKQLLAMAREEYEARGDRLRFFPAELFGEPSWDMLLDLYINGEMGKSVSVTSACLASRVPATTALRWLLLLEKRGLIARQPDTTDSRRSWTKLTSHGRSSVEQYLRRRLELRGSIVKSAPMLTVLASDKSSR